MAQPPPKSFGKPRKLATDYSHAAIKMEATQAPGGTPDAAVENAEQVDDDTPRSRRPGYTRPVLERSKPVMLYLDPSGVKALDQYRSAMPGFPRLHDIFVEAVEEWAAKRGISAPFRVTPLRKRRKYDVD